MEHQSPHNQKESAWRLQQKKWQTSGEVSGEVTFKDRTDSNDLLVT